MRPNCLTLQPPDPLLEEDDQFRISITCSMCNTVAGTSLWYRCDPKSAEKTLFIAEHGQTFQGRSF